MLTINTPIWVRDMLREQKVPFEECHHADAFTAQELAAREHVSGHRVAKVVVAMADGRPVELILPASRHVDLERVRQLLQARDVRLATETELAEYFSDCEVGAIPPLPHWETRDVLVDGALRCAGDILIQAGTHRDAVRLKFDDWFKVMNPRVESFSEPG